MTFNPHYFFSYSDADGFDVHETLEQAKAAAENALDSERDGASDGGWEEDATRSICYGRIYGGVEESARMPWNDHRRQRGDAEEDIAADKPQFDEFVEFKLEAYPT
jgi:hypothetical protein